MPEKKKPHNTQRTYAAETTTTLQIVPLSEEDSHQRTPSRPGPQGAVAPQPRTPISPAEQQALVDKLIHFLSKF